MRKRRALTALEVVVIIAIVIILAGLLIPEVHRSNGGSRRNYCSFNAKNHCLAMIQHENTHQFLPGYIKSFGFFGNEPPMRDPDEPNLDSKHLGSHHKLGGWAVQILPWLEAQVTYEHWSDDQFPIVHFERKADGVDEAGFTRFAAPPLSIFQCPSAAYRSDQWGANSYVANTGLAGQVQGKTLRFNGVVHSQLTSLDHREQAVPAGPKMRLDDLVDGQGLTALIGESNQAMPWHRVGFLTAGQLASRSRQSKIRHLAAAQFTQGMCWQNLALPNRSGINSIDEHVVMTIANAAEVALASSLHLDGVNMGFADGSTRFIGDRLDAQVYRSMLIPNDAKSDSPTPEFILTDELAWDAN